MVDKINKGDKFIEFDEVNEVTGSTRFEEGWQGEQGGRLYTADEINVVAAARSTGRRGYEVDDTIRVNEIDEVDEIVVEVVEVTKPTKV